MSIIPSSTTPSVSAFTGAAVANKQNLVGAGLLGAMAIAML
jgi:hypothetical protein